MKKLSARTKTIILGMLTVGMVGMLSDNWSSDGCVDVTLGPVQLSVPQKHMTPTTPRKSDTGNFIFTFDSTAPGIECPVGCKDLFVTITYGVAATPEQQWIFREPKFTGHMIEKYRIYLSRFDWESSRPLEEILVPMDAIRPQDEFYACLLVANAVNPLCTITVVAKSGLVAQFSIPRRVLVRARDAARFVTQSIDQFSENNMKGICK